MNDNELWLLISARGNAGLPLLTSSLAWIAEEAGASLCTYFESEHDGQLFARHGSAVHSGGHYQAFNELCCSARVKIIRYGKTFVFDTSCRRFGLETIAESDSMPELYRNVLEYTGNGIVPSGILFAGKQAGTLQIEPYLFPEIAFRRTLAFLPEQAPEALEFHAAAGKCHAIFLSDSEKETVMSAAPEIEEIDRCTEQDDYGSLTLRIARRWRQAARSLFFGDSDMLTSRIADEYRRRSVALYAPAVPLASNRTEVADYVEGCSAIAEEVAELAQEIGNPVIAGRQTRDGDLIAWSRHGVAIEIVDPGRPCFPVMEKFAAPWSSPSPSHAEEFPEEQLRTWAQEGKVLTTLLWHSGESAHNEAMLNVVEFAAMNRLKMGIGVHAGRYENCSQLWEQIAIPAEAGGAREYIEPLLHSGGLGVLAEQEFPPDALREQILAAQRRIAAVAGESGVPRGYLAFLDTDLKTFRQVHPEIWNVAAECGFDYFLSSAQPGRNRLLMRRGQYVVLNQSCRVIESSSPFVRIAVAEDLNRANPVAPGWIIGTLDAPVVAFQPYIWRCGNRFTELAARIATGGNRINVKPATVARYARILQEEGFLPGEPL